MTAGLGYLIVSLQFQATLGLYTRVVSIPERNNK